MGIRNIDNQPNLLDLAMQDTGFAQELDRIKREVLIQDARPSGLDPSSEPSSIAGGFYSNVGDATLYSQAMKEDAATASLPGTLVYSTTGNPGADRVNAAALKGSYGTGNPSKITATTDENGQAVLTGSGSARSGMLTSSVPGAMEGGALGIFRRKMEEVSKLSGEARLMAVAELKGAYQGHLASSFSTFQSTAQGMAGVPVMQAQLKENEALDKADPDYPKKLRDSPATARVRADLLHAQKYADQILPDLVKRSPELATIGGMMDIFLSKEAAYASGEMKRADDVLAKKEAVLEKVGPIGLEIAGILSPEIKEPSASAAKFMEMAKDKEVRFIYDNYERPQALVEAVTDPVNAKVSKVVAHQQAMLRSNGNSEAYSIEYKRAARDIEKIQFYANSPEGRLKAEAAVFPPGKAADRKVFESGKLLAMNAAATPKEKQEITDSYARKLALDAIGEEKKAEFSSSINNWNPGIVQQIEKSSALGPVVAGLKSSGAPVGLMEVTGAIAAIPDNNVRQAAKTELLKFAGEAAIYADRGIYGKTGGALYAANLINAKIMEGMFPSAKDNALMDLYRSTGMSSAPVIPKGYF